jgi:hypothetical protein
MFFPRIPNTGTELAAVAKESHKQFGQITNSYGDLVKTGTLELADDHLKNRNITDGHQGLG